MTLKLKFSDENLKLERVKDMPELKKEIISYLFTQVSNRPYDRWWKYTGEFVYEKETYNLECECRYDTEIFSYRNLFIERKQKVIEVSEMVRRGLLND